MISLKENRLPPRGKSVLMVMGGSIHHDRRKGTTHKKEPTDFETIELLGQSALFTNERLTNEDIPQGMYCYHLRHGDDGQFCTVERKVAVNHGGSVITREPIDFGEEGYISFTEETSPNFTGESMTFGDFMRDQSPQEGEVMKLC